MPRVERLRGREILDSRGLPTVEATCQLESGATAAASVPSGRSTGAAEARERRDGERRYRGRGCRQAAAHVGGPIHDALAGRAFPHQAALDEALIALDGTPDKSGLGANALLAVSLAFARASALERGLPLYRYLGELVDKPPTRMPRLTINLFSGGRHAGEQVAIQDVLVVPASPGTVDASLEMMHDIFHSAAGLILERYGMRLLTADEGGLAPPFESAEAMLATAVEAIEAAGYSPGEDALLAVDVAASHFYERDHYAVDGPDAAALDADAMIGRLEGWVREFPVVSVEDGLAEDDWEHWPGLRERLGDRALVVGDDLLCTNPARIRRAVDAKACNALLLKVNQVGTLTEAAEACRIARGAGWAVTVSVRSGETEDHWAADLAVGWSGDQFKNGSITQSERLAKYNRLLAIESEASLPMNPWPLRRS
jgi:enolase